MARTKTSPDTAPSAAHAAPDPAPAPGTAPAADSPAAAVHAALAASPGSAVAVIADAAGTGKPAARAALLAMEKDGTATRVKGDQARHPGHLDPRRARAGRAGPATRKPSSPASPTRTPPAARTVPPKTRRPAVPDRTALPRPATPRRRTATTPRPAPPPRPARRRRVRAARRRRRRRPRGRRPGRAGRRGRAGQRPGRRRRPARRGCPGGRRRRGRRAPDPALVTELTERLDQIRAAADAAGLVLTASGDLKTVLAGLDEIYEQAAQARRALKAAIGGRKAPAARPARCATRSSPTWTSTPDKEFTPHEIHKVLNHSSGAIANALETLVKHGEAEVATEKPRRFAGPPSRRSRPRGGQRGRRAEQDGTELAGAA